jgi:LysM repeat protein/predicted esterase
MKLLQILGFCFCLAFSTKAQEVVPITQLENTYNFLLHKPDNKDNEIKPVILFLHGRSLSGNNLNKVKQYGIMDDILHRGRSVDAYVIAPQVPSGQSWAPNKLKVLLDYVHENYPTDRCKVYVVGMSLGGYGTMDFVGTYPEEVTAAMALCGGGNVKMAESLAKVPLWIMHGKRDAAVPHSESEKVYNAIQNCCETNLTRFSSFPTYGHGEFARVFYAKQMYDWLYQFDKDQVSADKLMDIEIFDTHLKHVYTENKPKKVVVTSPPKDSIGIKSEPVETFALMPKKKKQENRSFDEVKVSKGDTYYSLAKKYKISIEDLLKYNKLTEKDLLKEGAKIKIPTR